MSKKNKPDNRGFVFSTDPDFHFQEGEPMQEDILTPAQQKLKIKLDTRHRAGKAVTVVGDFRGTNADLEKIGKQLKNFCGAGGSVKEGVIIIQGDHREKVLQWLIRNGYSNSKKY